MSVLETLRSHFVPSHSNSYRPHLLRKEWLAFFVVVIFLTEGVFVSSFFTLPPGQISVAAVANAGVSPSPMNTLSQNLSRQFARFAADSREATPWILGSIATMLFIALLFTFFIHVQIQQPEMLFSGALVVMFAVSLIVTNAQVAGLM